MRDVPAIRGVRLLAAFALLLGAALAAVALTPPAGVAQEHRRPVVQWTPERLDVDVPVGGSTTQMVTVDVRAPVPDAAVEATPSLADVVAVADIAAGDGSHELPEGTHAQALSISAPADAAPGDELDGTLRLRSGRRTVARPLPVTVTVVELDAESVEQRMLTPASHRLLDVDGVRVVRDEVLMAVDPAAPDPPELARAIAARHDAVLTGSAPDIALYQLRVEPVDDLADLNAVVAAVAADDDVGAAMATMLDRPAAEHLPNDREWDADWDEANPGGNTWHLETIRAPSAWRLQTSSPDVTVAVIDGDFRDHEDLDFTAVTPVSPEGVEWSGGFAAHGTKVAGVLCAVGNNAVGISGVTWACDLRGYDVASLRDGEVDIYPWDTLRAIAQAGRDGADVVNMSLGPWFDNPTGCSRQEVVEAHRKRHATYVRYILEAEQHTDALWVNSAGNSGCDASHLTPYNLSEALPDRYLTVAATDEAGALADFSNHGAVVSLAAPGVNILATGPAVDAYTPVRGTSYAAPLVSGTAALMMAYQPGLSVPEIHHCLLQSTRHGRAVPGHDFDELNTHAALECARELALPEPDPPDPGPVGLSFEAGAAQRPGVVVPGAQFDPPVAVQLVDGDGAPAASPGVEITVSAPGEVLSGTQRVTTDDQGLAEFSDLGVRADIALGEHVLTAAADDLGSAHAAFAVHADLAPGSLFTGSWNTEVHALGPDGSRPAGWGTGVRGGVYRGHFDGVLSVAVSPDGQVVYTASADEQVHAVDRATGERLADWGTAGIYEGPLGIGSGDAQALALSADGGTLYIGYRTGEVHAVDAATGQPLADWGDGGVYDGHDWPVNDLALTPDDATLFTASGHGPSSTSESEVHALDAATGERRADWADGGVYRGHDDRAALAVAVSRDGGTLYAASWGGRLHALGAASGERLSDWGDGGVYADGMSRIGRLVTSPDGQRVFAAGRRPVFGGTIGAVQAISAATGERVGGWADDGTYSDGLAQRAMSLAIAPDGHTLYVGDRDAQVHALAAASGTLRATWAGDGVYRGHRDGTAVPALAVAGDGGRLYTGGGDNDVHAVDAASGRRADDWAPAQGVYDRHTGRVEAAVTSPDGSVLYTASGTFVHAVEAATGQPLRHWGSDGIYRDPGPGARCMVRSMAVSPDGDRLYLGCGLDREVQAVNARTGRRVSDWGDDGRYTGAGGLVAVAPDSGTVYAGGVEEVHAIDAATGRVADGWVYTGHGAGGLADLVVAPDGGTVFLGALDGEVHALDAATGRRVAGWADDGIFHGPRLDALAVTPDGATLFTASLTAGVRALDAVSGEARHAWGFAGRYEHAAHTLAVAPDGGRLYSGGWFGDVHAISVATGERFTAWADGGVYRGHVRQESENDDRVAAIAVLPAPEAPQEPAGQVSFFADALYDVATGEEQPLLAADPRAVFGLEAGEPLSGPAWSPDGQLLALQSADALGVFEVGAAEARTWVEADDIVPGAELRGEPAWSPDGTRIATTAGSSVAIVDAADGSVQRVVDAGVHPVLTTAAWSPDGAQLVYGTLDEDVEQRVRVLSAITGDTRELLTLGGAGTAPGTYWSPDGQRIAVRELAGRVWVAPAEGGPAELVLDADAAVTSRWLPDGAGLVASTVGPTRLVVVDVAAGAVLTLAGEGDDRPVPDLQSTVSVSPDGWWVAYDVGAGGGPVSGTFLVRVDGQELTQIHELARSPRWRPD